MSETDCFNVVFVVFEVFDVGNEVVDTRVVGVSEKNAHVNNKHFVFVFDDGHVFADANLAEAADGDDADGVWVGMGFFEHGVCDLLAVVAVVARLVDGDADDVLSGLSVDVLAEHALVVHHLTFAGGDGEVDLAFFCLGLSDGLFFGGLFGLGGVFGGFGGLGGFVFDKLGIFAARSEVGGCVFELLRSVF